jgi:hypothetical protein
MSKIASFKVEIPCDDPVKAEAVKAILLDEIRKLGAKPMAAEAVDGRILAVAETTAFFNAASVKTFVVRGERPAAGVARPRVVG